jgi:formylmethanofuran dehydrogenase subunit B
MPAACHLCEAHVIVRPDLDYQLVSALIAKALERAIDVAPETVIGSIAHVLAHVVMGAPEGQVREQMKKLAYDRFAHSLQAVGAVSDLADLLDHKPN